MFSLTVSTEFCAAHALVIAGQREVIHGHNFRVTACIEGNALDGDGLLCDFHTVESFLHEIIEPFVNANLNATPSPLPRAFPGSASPKLPVASPHTGDELSPCFGFSSS
jgi:6-pyruvoyl-tetrahydropterin synthase